MQELTAAAAQAIRDIGQRYGVSEDAVRTMLSAVSAGGGSMAQFYCPELGGGGQWMRGGMTMVGDMFDSGLQARVNNLCSELSSLLASHDVFVPPPRHEFGSGGGTSSGSGAWWPTNLGSPSSTGGQNDTQYAYFPDTRRLAIREGGRVSLYDTLDHRIGGVQQQQGGAAGSLSFTSQLGTFAVGSLPHAPDASAPQASPFPPAPAYAPQQAAGSAHHPPPAYDPQPTSSARPSGRASHELLAAIERLGDLHRKGVLTDTEFHTKKAELLAQL